MQNAPVDKKEVKNIHLEHGELPWDDVDEGHVAVARLRHQGLSPFQPAAGNQQIIPYSVRLKLL